MEIGLERAGFRPLVFLDTDQLAQRAISLNRPEWRLWRDGDAIAAARGIHPAEFGLVPGELDLISGGPPCQPFSTAAQWAANGRRGMADARSQPVHALFDIVDSFLPKMVILENVPGFLKGPGSAISDIARRIESTLERYDVHYELHWRVVNAADFGVPQNRQRAIALLVRSDFQWDWPHPTHLTNPITAWDALADVKEDQLPLTQGKWTELLACIPEGWNYQWLTTRGGGSELFGYRTRYWNFLLKLAKHLPSWTLPASPGPATGPFHWDNRPLTTRERMRLQSFPDSWELPGDIRAQTRLVGNATPPLLAEVFGVALAQILGDTSRSGHPTLLRNKTNRIPAQGPDLSPLPEQFRHLVGDKTPHLGTGRGPSPRAMQT